MADSVRSLKITGVAATDFQRLKGGGGGRGKQATRRLPSMRKLQEGGDAPPGQSITTAANYAAAANISKKLNMRGGATVATNIAQVTQAVLATPKTIGQLPGTTAQQPQALNTPAVNAALQAGTTPPVTPPATVVAPEPQKGGKVTLLPSRKKKASRVVLAPPAGRSRAALPVTKTRKIRVQLSGLKKRMTKAKTITKDSREKPIEEIRRLLEDAKLVKPAKEKTKVPETVLRDIYKDYLLLRNRAL